MKISNRKRRKTNSPKHQCYALPNQNKYPIDTVEDIILVLKYFTKIKSDVEIISKNIQNRLDELHINIFDIISEDHPFISYLKSAYKIKNTTSFIVTTKLSKGEIISPREYSITLKEAIDKFLKNHYTSNELPYNKMKKYVYTFNKEDLHPIQLGIIRIFVYNDSNNYEYEWADEIEDYSKKSYAERIDGLISNYNNKVIQLGKQNHTMYIPRLSKDRFGNIFMRFNESKDRINNKAEFISTLKELDRGLMGVYVISDIHFGKEDEEKDVDKINFINKTVKEDDILFILGDIGYIQNLNRTYLINCIKYINCKYKFLVLGNHDIFPLETYYQAGILGIYSRFHYNNIIFSHQPCNCKDEEHEINFHGHLHNTYDYDKHIINTKNKVDCYYRKSNKPLTVKELLETLKESDGNT